MSRYEWEVNKNKLIDVMEFISEVSGINNLNKNDLNLMEEELNSIIVKFINIENGF